MLAEGYQVCGVKELLLREGLWSMDSACQAMQYAKSAEGAFEELEEGCLERGCWDLWGASEGGLCGVQHPSGIAVDSEGRVFDACAASKRVVMLSKVGV